MTQIKDRIEIAMEDDLQEKMITREALEEKERTHHHLVRLDQPDETHQVLVRKLTKQKRRRDGQYIDDH